MEWEQTTVQMHATSRGGGGGGGGGEGGVQWKKNARVMGGGGGAWDGDAVGHFCDTIQTVVSYHLPTWVISSSFLISSFFTPSEYCSRNISRFRAT